MPSVSVVSGDITEPRVDAIVNAANTAMRGGGGVDGAIHRAGGPAVLRDCIARFPHGLATGDAGWTTAGDLPSRWVIHVVGPDFRSGQRDRTLLESCYRRALAVADELGARTLAAPLVSAGVDGWPLDDAIDVAVRTLAGTSSGVAAVRLVAFAPDVEQRMRAAVDAAGAPPVSTVADLLGREPWQWGLRGDPYLWRELRAGFTTTPLPASIWDLRSQLERAVERAVGATPASGAKPVHVARFDPGHGMSAGMVDLGWWHETGIPILIDRYRAATAD